jgi:hypothetical protein
MNDQAKGKKEDERRECGVCHVIVHLSGLHRRKQKSIRHFGSFSTSKAKFIFVQALGII